jgi:hypothetical protein
MSSGDTPNAAAETLRQAGNRLLNGGLQSLLGMKMLVDAIEANAVQEPAPKEAISHLGGLLERAIHDSRADARTLFSLAETLEAHERR